MAGLGVFDTYFGVGNTTASSRIKLTFTTTTFRFGVTAAAGGAVFVVEIAALLFELTDLFVEDSLFFQDLFLALFLLFRKTLFFCLFLRLNLLEFGGDGGSFVVVVRGRN